MLVGGRNTVTRYCNIFTRSQITHPHNLVPKRNIAAMAATSQVEESPVLPLYTRILPVNMEDAGAVQFSIPGNWFKPWKFVPLPTDSGANLLAAADALQTTLYPVAFPTETVYGLGANALSSAAVQGIYTAKQRPSDNPLIVHISSLEMLRRILDPLGSHSLAETNPIPAIYRDLITRFWPGPLSILLPLPEGSKLAPEVSAGQPTFAARMPNSILALALIQLAQLPLAAPSANASTRPSPTTAQHVAHDLGGRIEYILDGGPCSVGVESTVVDGLSSPPAILRPGGISIDQIRKISGWEDVVIGYKDIASHSTSAPRAPGMKYKHYSPSALVVLAEAHVPWSTIWQRINQDGSNDTHIGIIRTRKWPEPESLPSNISTSNPSTDTDTETANPLLAYVGSPAQTSKHSLNGHTVQISSMKLGPSTEDIARGLFAALREMDLLSVQRIYIEGIDDRDADAVMNRLRKAASEIVSEMDMS